MSGATAFDRRLEGDLIGKIGFRVGRAKVTTKSPWRGEGRPRRAPPRSDRPMTSRCFADAAAAGAQAVGAPRRDAADRLPPRAVVDVPGHGFSEGRCRVSGLAPGRAQPRSPAGRSHSEGRVRAGRRMKVREAVYGARWRAIASRTRRARTSERLVRSARAPILLFLRPACRCRMTIEKRPAWSSTCSQSRTFEPVASRWRSACPSSALVIASGISFSGKWIRPVVVRAVRDDRREAIGALPGDGEVIGRRLGRRIGRARIVGRRPR